MFEIKNKQVYLVRGDSANFTLKDFGIDYEPVAGDEIVFTVKKNPDTLLAYLKVELEDGHFIIDPEDTINVPEGWYSFDIELTKLDGTVRTFDYPNSFKLVADISQPNDIIAEPEPSTYVKSVNGVSGEVKIKTINSQSLMGEGNIVIQGGGSDAVWGGITGDIEDQEDLQEVFETFAKSSDIDAELEEIREAIDGKQPMLSSGENIKTINGESILGSGNLVIQGGESAVESVNGQTGNVVLDAEDVGALPEDTELFSGDYNDLTNKPTIPSIQGLATEAYVDNAVSGKQDALTAGEGISLEDDEIGINFNLVATCNYVDNHHDSTKQDTLTAGSGISIDEDNEITFVNTAGYQTQSEVEALIADALEEVENGNY